MKPEQTKTKLKSADIKVGDLMAVIYYVKVEAVRFQGQEIVVKELDHAKSEIVIRGAELIENSLSADQFQETKKVSKTTAAELLIGSVNCPFTVCFEKSDGTERTLRGRLVKPEPLLGRSMVEDLDEEKDRLRQVDHRTIKFLIVGGIKYVVK